MMRRSVFFAVGLVALGVPTLVATACGGRIRGGVDGDGGLPLGEGVVQDAGRVGQGKPDASTFPNFDSGFSSSSVSSACPLPVATSDVPAYEGPNPLFGPGSCTQSDISALTTSIDNSNSTPNDWFNAVSPSCQKCVFSGQNDANWQVVVLSPDLQSGLAAGAEASGFINIGSCFQDAPGGSAACGRGAEDFEACVQLACPSPDCDSDQGCSSAAQTQSCSTFSDELDAGCGGSLDTISNICENSSDGDGITSLVQIVCGPNTNAVDGG